MERGTGKTNQEALTGQAASKNQQLTELSSDELAVRSQAGCRESFALLVDRYGQKLLAFLYRRTANLQDAETLFRILSSGLTRISINITTRGDFPRGFSR